MGYRTDVVAVGQGKFRLEAVVAVAPGGIVVFACTPGYAHVGATAQAIPGPSLAARQR